MAQGQNYANHRKLVPLFHFGVGITFTAYFIWTAIRLLRDGITTATVMPFVLGLGLVFLFISIRSMVMRVQDRLIRLEMQLRLQQVLPADLRARLHELSVDHLVALRFAGDDEVVDLIRDILEGKLESRNAIKKKIRNWQGDYLRA
jgi:Na+-transporting methylmalonyl-CoA/oxaloacetate decarboxylase gamma subunit